MTRLTQVLVLPATVLALCVLPTPTSTAAPLVPDLGPVLVTAPEVNRIVKGYGPLQNDPKQDRNTPAYIGDGPDIPDSCRNTEDPTRAFGAGYEAFRTMTYSGPKNLGVVQTVATYPSPESAQQVYDAYVANLQDCVGVYPVDTLGTAPEISLVPGVPNTAVLEGSTEQAQAKLVQVYGDALFWVTAQNFPEDASVVWPIAELIQQKLDARTTPSTESGP
jgi:hypothetical protein